MQLLIPSSSGSRDRFGFALKHIGIGVGKIGLGCRREVVFLDWDLAGGGRWDLLASTSDQVLSFRCSCPGILFHRLQSLAGVLCGEILDLAGLLADDISGMLKLSIDELFILDIDQWAKEENASCDQGHAPERHDLDEIVRQKCSQECNSSNRDVLGEDNALDLNDEEVDEIFQVVKRGFEGLLGDLVVSSRSE